MYKKITSVLLAVLIVCSFSACTNSAQSNKAQIQSGNSSTSSTDATGVSDETVKDSKSAAAAKKNTSSKSSTTAAAKNNTSSKSTASATTKKNTASKSETTAKASSSGKKKTVTTTKKTTVDVRVTVQCTSVLSKRDSVQNIPASGYMFSSKSVSLSVGSSVYAALGKACAASGVSLVASNTMYGVYVSAIGGLAEKDCGSSSGWTYTVNGHYPPKSSDKYILSDGDNIKFIYKA